MVRKNRLILAAIAACSVALVGGCASSPNPHYKQKLQRVRAQNSQLQARNQQLQQKLAQQPEYKPEQMQKTASAQAPSGARYPANAQPGECYARVMTPAQYKTVTKKVKVHPKRIDINVVPADYKWVEKRVKVKAASKKVVVVPATYKTVTQKIKVSPAEYKPVVVPAEYKTKTVRVVDVPKHTEWHRGTSLLPNAIKTKVDSDTGEIMCLVTVPATYKTISKKVLVSPATTKKVQVEPAEYKTVTRKVVDEPAHTKTVTIPAEYKTVRVRKLVSEATTRKDTVPAEYKTVTTQKLVEPESMSWSRVVCRSNMTHDLARTIQKRLDEHYYKGNIDGLYGPLTMHAVSSYADDHNLPSGEEFITYDVLRSLNIEPPQ